MFRSIVFILSLTPFFLFPLWGQEKKIERKIHWRKNLEEALKEGKKQQKLVLAYFFSTL